MWTTETHKIDLHKTTDDIFPVESHMVPLLHCERHQLETMLHALVSCDQSLWDLQKEHLAIKFWWVTKSNKNNYYFWGQSAGIP